MIGTRPEAIKMGPVAHALRDCGLPPTLVLTDQHVALDPADFGLEAYPAVRLGCPGEEDPNRHVQDVMTAMLPLLSSPPDLLVVQGDTSSALGAALAASLAGVAVAHVEAGLRTHDPHHPWPEEEYRTIIDDRAELLFAPTEKAVANLRAEGVKGEIHLTGNTGIDALKATEARLSAQPLVIEGLPRILVTCHRRRVGGRVSSQSPQRSSKSHEMARRRSTSFSIPTSMLQRRCASLSIRFAGYPWSRHARRSS